MPASVVVAQIPMIAPPTTLRRMIGESAIPGLFAAIATDRADRYAGRPATLIPIAGDGPGAALPDPGTRAHLAARAATSPSFRNEVTLASIDALLEFAPEAFIQRISPRPLLMTVADQDTLCPNDLAVAAYAGALILTLLADGVRPVTVRVAAAAGSAYQTEGVRTTIAEAMAEGAASYVDETCGTRRSAAAPSH